MIDKDNCSVIYRGKKNDGYVIATIANGRIRIDLDYIGEGVCGDYNENDVDDERLMRFDVFYYVNEDDPMSGAYSDNWVPIENASFCTNLNFDKITSREVVDVLFALMNEYDNAIGDYDGNYECLPRVKKLGEQMSHLSIDDLTRQAK